MSLGQEHYNSKQLQDQAEKKRVNGELKYTRVKHPVVDHCLTILRDKNTPPPRVRSAINTLTSALILEATKDLPTHVVQIETPLAPMKSDQLDDLIAIIPILRAGLGMHGAAQAFLEDATTLHLGLARDEVTTEAGTYYPIKPVEKLNGGDGLTILITDPMLATGGSARKAADDAKAKYPNCKKIRFIGIIAAPEGIKALNEAHPDVEIYVAAVDDHLNEHAYIVPGLGDAGDRQFGTG